MTDLLTADANQIKKLKVTAVIPALECVGPMFFEIIWQCEDCRSRNSFRKRYSLLPRQLTACTNCGTTYQYVYPHEYFKRLYEKKPQISAFEERLFRKVYEENDPSWTSLGKNLFFVISSMVLSGQKEGWENSSIGKSGEK
jgi:hypothetical protein